MHLEPDYEKTLTVQQQIAALAKDIAGVVAGQMGTFPGKPRDVVIQVLGQDLFDRMCRDIANNVIQALL